LSALNRRNGNAFESDRCQSSSHQTRVADRVNDIRNDTANVNDGAGRSRVEMMVRLGRLRQVGARGDEDENERADWTMCRIKASHSVTAAVGRASSATPRTEVSHAP